MSKTTELYTATIKGIQSQSFTVVVTVEKIIVKNPGTETIVFEGDIEAAQDWLLTRDFNQGIRDEYEEIEISHPALAKPLTLKKENFHFNCPCAFIPIERPPFRRNAAICCVLSILIFLGAILLDHKPGTLLLGLPGAWFFIIAFFNAAKHFQWERKISEISR